ncbi:MULTISPECIES: TIGR02391 family protein [Streptomyces]|uniref:TIGR02391 family protein n=1 Tax=Streptomyces anulatus TaxID=1892 RepID=A0ABZ1ZC65_STRAQ|nr:MULTISPECIES: TIGR02391 family protein [Streptomyces]MCX4521990.1 TIGR02391 family protein [Streptomyces anulatus]MCX4604866.1 TIGR02391 family protein [Streptomyces anulatus]
MYAAIRNPLVHEADDEPEENKALEQLTDLRAADVG